MPPKVLCLTPIKNEAWILDRFLSCASQWADHVVIADQGSTDGSLDIARRHPKATVVRNDSPAYDEGARQRLLIETARRLAPEGKRVLVALDADEMLTANWDTGPEWGAVLRAAPGTVIRFDWVNVLPGFESCWIPSDPLPLGFVDDGSEHVGEVIHSARIPVPAGAPSLRLRDVRVLHYQYANWERMESKQRWYQCWERLNHPTKRAITIFRQYRGMYGRPPNEIHPFQRQWIAGYEAAGIDMTDVGGEPVTWWDREIVELLLKHGPSRFRKQDIWDKDWARVAADCGSGGPAASFADPRTAFERRVHRWLRRTQPSALQSRVRFVQRALRLLGW